MPMPTLDDIAAQLQGYDPQALRVTAVNAFLERLVTPVTETETVGIFEALGRTLAADVAAPFSVPPHDNSAMDGFAFDGACLAGLPAGSNVVLRVVGTALAGKAWVGTVRAGECVKIMTGAVMPQGLDTVVPQELTQLTSNGDTPQITFSTKGLAAGDNRRLCGEDLMQGQAALKAGAELNAAALGLIASVGQATVTVYRRLRVAYFSTGDEVLSLGEAPREGAVYDSNRYTVFGLLTRLGCTVIDMGVVRDDPALLEAAFTQAAAQADAIITSGGVSVGEADFTKAMMKKLGDVAFWRIAMRPGRPMAVGKITLEKPPLLAHSTDIVSHTIDSTEANKNANFQKTALLFGLPGNPVAVMVTFLAFVRPALLQMMGRTVDPATATPLLQARSTHPLRKKPGRTEYQRAVVTTAPDGHLQVALTGNQGSGVLSSMVQANGLVVLHHTLGNVAAGDTVDVLMLEGLI